MKFSIDKKIALLTVYVDDIILIGDYEEDLLRLKKLLAKEFEIKDLGCPKYFLGIEVSRSKEVYLSLNVNMSWIYLKRPLCLDASQQILQWIQPRRWDLEKKVS